MVRVLPLPMAFFMAYNWGWSDHHWTISWEPPNGTATLAVYSAAAKPASRLATLEVKLPAFLKKGPWFSFFLGWGSTSYWRCFFADFRHLLLLNMMFFCLKSDFALADSTCHPKNRIGKTNDFQGFVFDGFPRFSRFKRPKRVGFRRSSWVSTCCWPTTDERAGSVIGSGYGWCFKNPIPKHLGWC